MNGLPLYESEAIRSITGPAVRPGSLDLTEKALSFCRLPAGSLVIDAGCGLGATVDHLQQNHRLRAMGVDRSPHMLQEGARRFPKAGLVLARAEQLPLPDQAAAAVICECVLSLVDDPVRVLTEYHRVLQPGGYLILSDIYYRNPAEAASRPGAPITCCLKGASGKDFLLERLDRTSFNVVFWEDHSDRLKQLAARIVWEYGSLSCFPEWFGCDSDYSNPSTKPGYFLLAAQKEA